MKNNLFFLLVSTLCTLPISAQRINNRNIYNINTIPSHDIVFDSVSNWNRGFIRDKQVYGYFNKEKKVMIPFQYKWLGLFDKQGWANAELNGKEGFINTQNRVVIPFIYDKLYSFEYGLAYAKQNGKYGWINRKNKAIIPLKYSEAGHFYKSLLAKVRCNGNYGFVDTLGKEVIPCKYENVDYTTEDLFVIIRQNLKWAFFNNKGKQLTPFEYEEIVEYKSQSNPSIFFSHGLVLVRKNGKFAYLDKELKEVVPTGLYTFALPINSNGYAIVGKQGKYGIIDQTGNLKVPLEYDNISCKPVNSWSPNTLTFIARKDGKIRFFNSQAEWIPKSEYDEISNINDNMYFARIGSSYRMINKEGVFCSQTYNEIIGIHNGYIARKDLHYGIINAKDSIIAPFEYDSIFELDRTNLLVAKKKGLTGLIDYSGKEQIPFVYQHIEKAWYNHQDALIVKKKDKFGTIDYQNKIIIPIEYDGISVWVEEGPDGNYVRKNNKYGLVDPLGNVLIPPIYDMLYVESPKIVKTKKGSKYGIIDCNNHIIIPFEYDKLIFDPHYPFETLKLEQDKFIVQKNAKWSYLDISGNILKSNIPETDILKVFGKVIDNEYGFYYIKSCMIGN